VSISHSFFLKRKSPLKFAKFYSFDYNCNKEYFTLIKSLMENKIQSDLKTNLEELFSRYEFVISGHF
jgi:hypothetical protein